MSRTPYRPSRARGLARGSRRLTAFGAAAALCLLAAPAAVAASPAAANPSASTAPKLPAGLYGAADPTYDGVFRQASALLALNAVRVAPPAQAVAWLTGQQCADGGFEAYRADPATACVPKQEDTNSTGLAVQALARLGGHQAQTGKAVGWLRSLQNTDGGWGYQRGSATDADSTAVVAGALTAAGTAPSSVTRGGKSPLDALLSLQVGCGAKAAQRGAFAYQPDPKSGKLVGNAKATTDGVLGAHGDTYLVAMPSGNRTPVALTCASASGAATGAAGSAEAGSAYLAGALATGGQHFTTAEPGSATKAPDFGTTADAVLALSADGHHTAALAPYEWLVKNGGDAWAKGSPAGLSDLILASAAVGANPHDFGGADLVGQLLATGPKGAVKAPAPVADHRTSGGGFDPWWLVGAGLVAGIGIGIGFSLRNKTKKQS